MKTQTATRSLTDDIKTRNNKKKALVRQRKVFGRRFFVDSQGNTVRLELRKHCLSVRMRSARKEIIIPFEMISKFAVNFGTIQNHLKSKTASNNQS